MENPTFKLEGVVKSREAMEDFEGPLTLILQLLSRNKIEIRDIRISEILDQYLAYLSEMKKLDLEIASEFITMASHLMYIKARTLLASEDSEEESELDALISSLEALKNRESFARLKAGTGFLASRGETGFYVFTKPPEPLKREDGYRYAHQSRELLDALIAVLGRERESGELPGSFTMPSRLVYPIGEKAEEIMLWLRSEETLPVAEIFSKCRSRSELVASFMAVLDLARNGGLLLVEDEDGSYMAQYVGSVQENAYAEETEDDNRENH